MRLLPENMGLNKLYTNVKLIKNISTILVALLCFCFRKRTITILKFLLFFNYFQITQDKWIFSIALLHFWFRLIVSKILIIEVRSRLKIPQVTILTETHEFTSRNYAVKKGLNVPKSLTYTNYFGCTPSFWFRKLRFLRNSLKYL